jgi:hypothetical protein
MISRPSMPVYRLGEVGRAGFKADDRPMYEGSGEAVPVAPVIIAEGIVVRKPRGCDIAVSSQ